MMIRSSLSFISPFSLLWLPFLSPSPPLNLLPVPLLSLLCLIPSSTPPPQIDEPQHIDFALEAAPALEAILQSYPRYITVSNLPADTDAMRLDIARAMVEARLVLVRCLLSSPPFILPPHKCKKPSPSPQCIIAFCISQNPFLCSLVIESHNGCPPGPLKMHRVPAAVRSSSCNNLSRLHQSPRPLSHSQTATCLLASQPISALMG